MTAKRIVGGCLAALTLMLVFAAGASAASENNLAWRVNGKLLGEGESAAITAKTEGIQEFKFSLAEVVGCGEVSLQSGANLLGAKLPASGKGEAKITFAKCEFVAGITHCEIRNGGFVTTALSMTTAYLSKTAAEKESIESSASGILLKPKSGEEVGKFTVSSSKPGCPEEATFAITGSFLESMLKVSGETVFNEELQTHSFRSSGQTHYFENEGGKTVEHTGVALKIGGEATLLGTIRISVASGSKYNLAT